MTAEGIIMIVILCFALLKTIQSQNHADGLASARKKLFSKSSVETVLFFGITVLSGLSITHHILGLVLLNAILWSAYHVFLKNLKYNLLAWLSLGIYCCYTYASYITFDKLPYTETWYFTLFCWEIPLLFMLLYDTLGKHLKILSSAIAWVISAALLFVPGVFIVYRHSFTVPMEVGQLYSIYQSSFSESAGFIGMYISPIWPILMAAIFIGVLLLLLFQEFTGNKNLNRSTYFYTTLVLLLLVNLNMLQGLALPKMVFDTIEQYQKELSTFRKELQKRDLGDVPVNATKDPGKELYVVIIGESLNKNHMGLYGYHRATTPHLNRLYEDSAFIKFEEVFSPHTHTVSVLPQALTAANQLNGKKYYTSVSILDILDAANIETYWLSNQIAHGGWDNPVSVLADRADHRINFNSNIGESVKTVFFDECLAIKIDEILAKGITKNTAIFIHLMGNHGVYQQRYPPQFRKYEGELSGKEFGKNNYYATSVNAYDNSVLYNDSITAGIIRSVQKIEGIAACLYFSDHGEDVLTGKGHQASDFTYSMIQTPMIFWASDAYKSKFSNQYDALKTRTRHYFSTGLLYDMLIGIMGITADDYSASHDLSNDAYHLPIEDCYILDHKKAYGGTGNYFYHQRENARLLDSLGMLSRVFPHRVNTTGKLNSVRYNGNKGCEIDVIFRKTGTMPHFEVGHDEGSLTGMTLEELLSMADSNQLQKVWLDIKNLNEQNITAIVQRLKLLDKQFNLRQKAIVESSTTSVLFAELASQGFHTTYYLPTEIEGLDPKLMPVKAADIASQILKQQVQAISFDVALYPFVKQHLEKSIRSNIVYHTWDLSLQLQDVGFIDNLKARDFYADARVKSILVGYHSDFEI